MRTRITLFVLASLIGCAGAASAEDSAAERASLTGLGSISIVVEALAPIAERSGLSGATMEADVQRRLRQAGMSITPDADAYLYVHVKVADPGGASPLPYTINVALMQEVTLPRGLRTRTPLQVQTWWLSSLGLTSPDRLRGAVTDRVSESVEQFIRAYRSVNPKP